jgi:predicted phosphodiesterase
MSSRIVRLLVVVLPAGLFVCACDLGDLDLTRAFRHPSTERRVQESLALPVPDPPAVAPDSFSFALFGDLHVNLNAGLEHRLGWLRDEVVDRGIGFVVVLGDLADQGLPDEFSAVRAALDSLDVPVYATVGNHDLYQADGWELFKDNFGPASYAVTVADRLKLILLDTAGGELGATQFDWLERELADTTSGVKLVGTHYALFDGPTPIMWRLPSGAERYKFLSLMRDHGVFALVSGHLHGFRHTTVYGTEHFIVGTMGTGALDYGEPGYLLMTWARGTLSWQYVTAPE